MLLLSAHEMELKQSHLHLLFKSIDPETFLWAPVYVADSSLFTTSSLRNHREAANDAQRFVPTDLK